MSVRSALTRSLPLAFIVLCAASAPARAGDDVKISVVAILATDKNVNVDARVKCVAEAMKKAESKLTGFSVARMTCKEIAVGGKDSFAAVDGETVKVTVEKRCEKDKSRVCLKVEAPKLGAITYNTCCDKFFPLVTGYKTKDGDTLIVAVRVCTCEKK
jgi:hypothetical protein